MNIRIATNQDRDDIIIVYSSAFPEGESEVVTRLAINLLSEKSTPPTISLMAETDGSVVGHTTFSLVGIDNNKNCQAYILAPPAVKPEYKKCRIGSALIEYGMPQMYIMGENIVFVYGDPKYYCRFGSSAKAAHQCTTPYKLQYPFGSQAIGIQECATEKAPVAIQSVDSLCDPRLW